MRTDSCWPRPSVDATDATRAARRQPASLGLMAGAALLASGCSGGGSDDVYYSYDSGAYCGAMEEVCDGIDNDCNGVVDDHPECGWWGGAYLLTIVRGEGSAGWDMTNDPDFVVWVRTDQDAYATAVVRENTNPTWNDTREITFTADSYYMEIELLEWDEDPLFGVDLYEPVASWSWWKSDLEAFLTTDLGKEKTLEDGGSSVTIRLDRPE